MRHVWIVNHYAQEPSGPGGTRHYSLARHLPAYGWEASIIASSIEHVTGRQRLRPGEKTRLETLGGIPFLWLRGSIYSGSGRERIGNMISFTWAVLKRRNVSGLPRPDAVIGSSVHPLAAFAGRRLARRYGVPFLFEVRDLWPQTLVDMGRLAPHSPLTFGLRRLERYLYRSACKIIVLLPRAADYIRPLGIPADKIEWISNGVEIEPAIASVHPERTEFTLMYFGAHGNANGLDRVIRSMRIVAGHPAGRHIRLRLIGDGPLKPRLIALAHEIGADNVTFEAPVPKQGIPALAAEADAFIIYVNDLPELYKYGISMNKIFDYMAAARPTIIAATGVDNPIAESGGGIAAPAGDTERLAEAILRMAGLPAAERAAMGTAARRYVQDNYSFGYLARRLAETLNACGASR